MEEKIDEKDLAILDILREHGDYTVRQIAKKTLLAPTTVHSRIKKLRKMGVIRRFTIDVDERKLGNRLGAYVLISVDLKLLKEKHKSQHDLAKEIEKLPSVRKVHTVAGGSADLVARVRTKDIEEFDVLLLEKIQMLEGVLKTQTMMILH